MDDPSEGLVQDFGGASRRRSWGQSSAAYRVKTLPVEVSDLLVAKALEHDAPGGPQLGGESFGIGPIDRQLRRSFESDGEASNAVARPPWIRKIQIVDASDSTE